MTNRPHRHRTRTIQSCSPAGANVNADLIHASWTHMSPYPKRHLDRLSRFCTAHGRESLYLTMPPSLKIAPSHGRSELPSNVLPARVHNPNDMSIGSAVFAGLTIIYIDRPTDRQTDRSTDPARYSITIGRIYVRSTAMRPNRMVKCSHDNCNKTYMWNVDPKKVTRFELFCCTILNTKSLNDRGPVASQRQPV